MILLLRPAERPCCGPIIDKLPRLPIHGRHSDARRCRCLRICLLSPLPSAVSVNVPIEPAGRPGGRVRLKRPPPTASTFPTLSCMCSRAFDA